MEARQKTIGMIGGMSWESTAEYYRLANQLTRDRLGGLHSASVLIASVDFAEIEEFQSRGEWSLAGAQLAEVARSLETAGAELLILCTNTMHKVAPAIEAAVSIPFLHLADATATAVRAAGIRTVGLLGTAFTMEQDFYRERLRGHGLEVVVPGEEDRALVHRVIYDELCRGLVGEESRAEFTRIIGLLADRGACGVILGCTEIELLVGPEHSPIPTFPTSRLHIEAAIAASFS
ncbi:MAG: aspartate/glutamate racemase family protein [Micropruina sp.]|nr:aspartate/glutamate racemase family protein [Micropruina sp.]